MAVVVAVAEVQAIEGLTVVKLLGGVEDVALVVLIQFSSERCALECSSISLLQSARFSIFLSPHLIFR